MAAPVNLDADDPLDDEVWKYSTCIVHSTQDYGQFGHFKVICLPQFTYYFNST